MAFVRLIAASCRLQNYKKALFEEKQEAIKYQESAKRRFKFSHLGIKIRMKLRKLWRRIGYCCCCKKFCFNLKHSGSVENYVLKSIAGFFGGLILTYICFMLFVFQLNFTFTLATMVCSIMGCILVNGLAFSSKVRCVVLLTLPHFFSERGRQMLVAYALLLVISGPAKNTLNNLGILSESLACGQEQLKSIVKQIIEVIKKPFYALKDAIKKVIETVKKIIKQIKDILIKIKRIVMGIIRVIKAAFMFLAKIINICNKELGTPFERCSRVFDNAIADCNAKLGAMFSWMCSITYIVKSVCYLVKIFDYVCMIVDFIKDSIIGVVVRKIKGFVRHIRTMFYVRIRFSHSFHFETKASKSISDISKDILNEIKERSRKLVLVFKFFTSTASLFLIFMIAKVLIYRYKFLTDNSFDNKFITNDFFKIDMRRAKINRETVLPLNSREKKIYVKIKSTKLTDIEKKKLKKAVTTLATINMKAAIYMVIDYSLYWILNLIGRYGRFQSKVEAPNIPIPHISGKGLLANLLTSIVKAFQPIGLQIEIDTVPCLPTPIPPNLDRYIQIATLLILCWVLTLLEPYGLRLRTFIMCYYHPLTGRQRAIWLYNNILRKRSSFLKFARRQLRRRVLGSKDIEKVTLKEFLVANFRCLSLCFDTSQSACLLCGKVFRENDLEKPIRCQTPECPGLYCSECFADLRNLCTVCLSPIEYGDISDLSEEKDSSEEEQPPLKQKQPKSIKAKKKSSCHFLFDLCSKMKGNDTAPLLPIVSRKKSKKKFFSTMCSKKPKTKMEDEEILLDQKPTKSRPSLQDNSLLSVRESKAVEESKNISPREEQDSEEYEEELNEEVKKLFEESTDSGQISASSTMSSTDYSYSYQYEKDEQQIEPAEVTTRDVEQQATLDYASMDSFRKSDDEGQFGLDKDRTENMSSKLSITSKASMNSIMDSFTEMSSTDKIEKRVDVGTEISGDALAKFKHDQHIEFIGVRKTDPKQQKPKRKRKKKSKYDDIVCSCSDSEECTHNLKKVSLTAIPKSTTFTNTRKGRFVDEEIEWCSCKRSSCKCNLSVCSFEEENTTDTFPFESSTELTSLIEFQQMGHSSKLDDKAAEIIEMDTVKYKKETAADNLCVCKRATYQKGIKPSRVKMLIRKIMPKYKIQKEK